MSDAIRARIAAAAAERREPFLLSNAVVLSGRQLVFLGLFAAALVLFAPAVWERLEPIPAGADARVPYELSGDYWLWERMAADATSRGRTVLLGDSVVWGQYVGRDGTLSRWLNALAGEERFANLGVDGMHPAALAGLVEHLGGSISGLDVVLSMNPLWLASPGQDLQDGSEEWVNRFNHPGLVPQFFPGIPCYREEVSRRLGLVVQRNLPFSRWTIHLQQAYFDGMAIPDWTIENPSSFPERLLSGRLPDPGDGPRHRPVPWTEAGIGKTDFAWVDLATSFQWARFRRALEVLRGRGNRVLVVVGPFNEHMLTGKGLAGYARIRDGVAAWLSERGIDHVVPPALPSELWADASHPLSEGYRRLAGEIYPRLLKK